MLKLLTILLFGSPYLWWTRQQVTAGSGQVRLQRSLDNGHVQPLHKATNAEIAELAGTSQFKIFVMVNIKKLLDLTSQSCNTRERALGSLPANRAFNSDQVISSESGTPPSERASWSGPHEVTSNKQASSSKRQAFEPTWSTNKRQASQP